MTSVAAVVAWTGSPPANGVLKCLQNVNAVNETALVVPTDAATPSGQYPVLHATRLWSTSAVVEALQWFEGTGAAHLLLVLSPSVRFDETGLKRLVDCAQDTSAPIVYSDYFDLQSDGSARLHPLVDYQLGSLRDDFDLGQVVLLDRKSLAGLASLTIEESADLVLGGWYDLRLRLSERGPVLRVADPTYTVSPSQEGKNSGESHFDYVDPRNRDYQIEMERIATAHLKRIGAFLDPPTAPLVEETSPFPVEASIVIPVKNRERTVADAVGSALSQQASFEFNVIVVDNHSSDGTTRILTDIAQREPRLVHWKPARSDLQIGGCWNEAIYSDYCGRYAIQLDSDDIYSGDDVLSRIVAEFQNTGCAMVIGSYSIVNFDLQPIPPGLVDHREWTDENGHNNALRIAGLGAPRAFHVPTLRSIGFPNISFGEDYAVGLQMTRKYRIGRIYDSLYWCRRWEDNTDHLPSLEAKNRFVAYKDRLRTIEITARQRLQQERSQQV